ncbi:CUE domain-containing protein 3 [Diplogelasinospora grovesii]|uniref:CUE domain-containing protein 3 n=1 Tax=Diplogelasinospora grovesii TaxID=303347 RepID=A0AAN6S3D4_9PEZI|nr:CUE domain-containing protein 3 [Diplogelasinospora grovesii]
MSSSALPAFALFPLAAWRDQLLPDEWVACLTAWVALVDSHLSLSEKDFLDISTKDESLESFLTSFTRETALGGTGILGSSQSAKRLLKDCFLLTSKLLQSPSPPSGLAQWEFLADLSRVYGKKKAEGLLSRLSQPAQTRLDSSLAALKKFLVKNLDDGINGDIKGVQDRLGRVNDLIHASPSVATFFLAGSDFLDGLVSCYKVMNPPLRQTIITTTYLCLVGLVEGQKIGPLTDQLYSLKAAAEAHKSGPLNVNDSLVAELVTATPLLQQLQHRLEQAESMSSRTKSVLAALGTFKKAGGGLAKSKRLIKRKVDKGKGVSLDGGHDQDMILQQEMHVHRMSQISQIQDLFPELGSGFVAKLLDEYGDDPEQVIAHLLDGSLPAHLQSADRSEELSHDHAPEPANSITLPDRRNVFDEDDDLDLSRLQIGKRNLDADRLLADRSSAPKKAAILSALAAFDSDDDERDDTYDAADVGGTVDTTAADEEGNVNLAEATEETLFRTFSSMPKLFERDHATRRGKERGRLREETGMTDEAIEGWALMLGRNEKHRRRLQARYGEWTGAQQELESTAWRAAEDNEEGSDSAGPGSGAATPGSSFRGGSGQRGGGHGRGRGRGGGGGRGGGAGTATPPTSERERRRKEARGSGRREGRARKMARGGGLPG